MSPYLPVPRGRSEEAYNDLELQMIAANPPDSLWSPIKVDERPQPKVDLDARPARLRVHAVQGKSTEEELKANIRDYWFSVRKADELKTVARMSQKELKRRKIPFEDVNEDTTILWPRPYTPKLAYNGGELGGWPEAAIKRSFGWTSVPGASESNIIPDSSDDDDDDDDETVLSAAPVRQTVARGRGAPAASRSRGEESESVRAQKRRRVTTGPLSLTSTRGQTSLEDRGEGGSDSRMRAPRQTTREEAPSRRLAVEGMSEDGGASSHEASPTACEGEGSGAAAAAAAEGSQEAAEERA